ncbi:MAG: ATP-binding cassette domain-containing protein [Acidimicrobiia bacterium]
MLADPTVTTAPRPAPDALRPAVVEADSVSVQRGGRRILAGVDLWIPAGQLVVLAGPSGAGKTTLLEVLAGLRTPSAGAVAHRGRSVGTAPDRVGFVPQDDLVHRELPLEASLLHAAGLLVDEPRSARQARVERVMRELDLLRSRSVAVGELSGGQRKRASVAVELLGEPEVLFLDEPTSGLDPATAAEVRTALRRLVHRNVTVVLTSHHLSDLEAADRLVLLSPAGEIAYDGAPQLATRAFGVEGLSDVYLELVRGKVPHPVRRFSPEPSAVAATVAGSRPARPGAVVQWRTLVHRNAATLARGRLTLAVLLGSPVLVTAMMVTLFPPGVLDAGPLEPLARQLTFWLAFAAFFFGLTFGLLQVVDDVPILRRENRAGLGVTTYLAAKVAVLVPLLAVVVGLLVGTLQVFDRLPPHLGRSLLPTLMLEAVGALALGLLASSLVRTPAQAALALPMLCFPQVLFAGAVVPVPAMPLLGRAVSHGLVNRWGFDALQAEILGAPGDGPLTEWAVLLGLALVSLMAAVRVLDRRCAPG